MLLLDVGDSVEGVLLSPALDLPALGRLAATCKPLNHLLSDRAFLLRIAAAQALVPTYRLPAEEREEDATNGEDERGGHASIAGPQADLALPAHSVASLEALAVHAALQNLKSHHIVFHLASLVIVPDSLAVLGEYAQVRSRVNLSIQDREHSY